MFNALRTIVSAGALLAALIGPAAANSEIRFATEAGYPPFNERAPPSGKITGWEIDLGMAMCAKMNRKCKFVAQDWDGMIPGLLSHRFDGIFSAMTISAERKKKIYFTDPYYKTTAQFVAKRNLKIDRSVEDLGGLTIGTTPGITQCYLSKHYPDAKVRIYQTTQNLFLDLQSGRVDAIFSEPVQAEFGLIRENPGADFAFDGDPVQDPGCFGEGVGIGVRKDDTALRTALNEALAAVRADGTYYRLTVKYFGSDIFGNSSLRETKTAPSGTIPITAGVAGSVLKSSGLPNLKDVIAYSPYLLEGLGVTIALSVGSIVLSVALGLIAASARLWGRPWLRTLAGVYTTVTRGIPDLVLMLLLYFGGQVLLNRIGAWTGLWNYVELNQFTAGVLAIGFIFGAYMSETFRGAYLSIPYGMIEAGISVGMTRKKLFSRIIWPQLVRYALPGFTNIWLTLMKSTALVSVIGLEDIVYSGFAAGRATRQPFTFMLVALFSYLTLTILSDVGLRVLERRYARGVVRGVGA
jgi:lysine-arginine-ornithine-binding protein